MSTTAKRVRLDTEKAQGGKEVEQQQDVEVKAVAGNAGTAGFSLREAIEKRTSVRAFTPQQVERNVLDSLLEAAVRAPTALQDECWSFVVVQDKTILKVASDVSKAAWVANNDEAALLKRGLKQQWIDNMKDPAFDLFYNAGTLIAICAPAANEWGKDDCWLAAENLMLAAASKELGTCVMGSAVQGLNTPELKAMMDVPPEVNVVVPLIIGYPADEMVPTSRKAPKVTWK